jgi:hypothetical protein
MLKQTLYVFLFKWRASEKFQVQKLDNVWRPHLKSLPPNCYMSQNKTFTRNLQTLEKLSYTNLKFDLKLVTLAKNFFWHIWNLKLSITWETCLAHTNFNVETLNNLKNSLSHTFSNFNIETFNNLKNSCSHTLHLKFKAHLKTYNTLKKSLPHLPFIWKSCKLLVCHHLEMNLHSLCKLKTFISKGFIHFFYALQAQNPSLFVVLTQCPFFCLMWAHNLLETTWKQARNDDSRFMKWNNCIN